MLEFWYSALHTEFGIIVSCGDGDIEPVRARLYAARRDAQDPELQHLSLCQSPTNPSELWIVKKPKPNGAGK